MAHHVEVDAGFSQWFFCEQCQTMQPPGHCHAGSDPEIEGWREDVQNGVSRLDAVEDLLRESYRFLHEM